MNWDQKLAMWQAYEKLLRVIKSCVTMEQLGVAGNCIINFSNLFEDEDLYQDLIIKKIERYTILYNS